MLIQLKRAYGKPAKTDGYRVLVDRIWPRGVSKATARIDEWMKEIAPSTELRKWFGHDPVKWDEFQKRYAKELTKHTALVEKLAQHDRLTLVFAAKDEQHNNAVALKNYLGEKAPQRSTGDLAQ